MQKKPYMRPLTPSPMKPAGLKAKKGALPKMEKPGLLKKKPGILRRRKYA